MLGGTLGFFRPASGGGGPKKIVAVCGVNVSQMSADNGVTWTQGALPAVGGWQGVAYGLGLFVAVAQTGNVAYSSDGTNWSLGNAANTSAWSSIAFGNGVFVAVPFSSNTFSISSDGITFNNVTVPSTPNSNWTSITFNGSIFIAVNDDFSGAVGGSCATSPDGVVWTVHTAITSMTPNYNDLAAIGTLACLAYGRSPDTATSANSGISWTRHASVLAGLGQGVTANSSLFICVQGSTTLQYSSDGVSWTTPTFPAGTYGWEAVTWNGTVFCAVENGSGARATTSPDAMTWTIRTIGGSGLTNSVAICSQT